MTTDPTRGEQFAALTYLGKRYYAERRYQEGATHEAAIADARYSYGNQRLSIEAGRHTPARRFSRRAR